ncbi:hypothetical protein [Actinomadura sp. HBU206391]|uniref:hypothetical protein n=1 Tax=Actinomadura sp. HBU206391 TaxID=2731692 RepID=UPI001650CFE0|nr:hypothetical protein [Actinomadura sp. HBU206391]MBC6458448.1 hypothetical protein [Actinomadura sp. HBU206391]
MSTPTEVQPTTRRAALLRERAEQARLDREAAVEMRAREAGLRLQQQREQDALDRERKAARAQETAEKRAKRRAARAAFAARLAELAPTVGRRVIIAGPILAPMTVAWIGQLGFATGTLEWPLAGGLVFAAGWELSTAFCGWMYHQARQDGDQGTIFRVATWLFASAAALMNYWHALPAHQALTEPTPKAASFGVMSLAGIALWELYTLLIHRRKLRADGKLPESRPRFGLARWTQYPRTTWVARSLSIRDGHATVDAAWSAAVIELRRRRHAREAQKAARRAEKLAKAAAKAGRSPVHITVVRGTGTRFSDAPMRTWTRPAVVWLPRVARLAAIDLAGDVPEPGTDQVQAAKVFAKELAAGVLPSFRAIKERMRVGQDKADEIRAYLKTLIRT